ncbi:hypothetical protein [Glycomyces paridis]|uniref:Uncharacterized protein n=1 Tax=Glycomyces paridis TaxID=2126555 RepID=A0A4S8PGK1_9ACTN|nr:hypothetical protein [Glycomyces paridis]THV29653.1 hypothetical protein E9998_09220 [Glycomyces paridis]
MHSLSGRTEAPKVRDVEPMLGIVPERMNYAADWRLGLITLELFLDRARGDGYLVLLDGRRAEEHIGTVFLADGKLRGIVWRGSAADRGAVWRADQQTQAARIVTEAFTDPGHN